MAGLHPDPFRTFAYMDRSVARAAHFQDLANQVSITPKPGATENEIARVLFHDPSVASVELATATTQFVRERLDDFIGVLRLMRALPWRWLC